MANEIKLKVRDLEIAAKVWHDDSNIPTLALHGWLDNAASFDNLAPLLPDCHIVAIDLPGHGYSSHPPKSATFHILDIATTAILVAQELGWEKFALVGHSLGAAVSSYIAGTIYDRILWSVLIDALGALTKPAFEAPLQYRTYINEIIAKPHKKSPRYETAEDAVQARLKANHMKESSVRILVERGLKQLENGQWTWRTDPRLLMPLAQLMTEEQVLAYLSEITSPVCVIKPMQGYPFPKEVASNRLKALKNASLFEMPGQHHVHLDSPDLVANAVHTFLTSM